MPMARNSFASGSRVDKLDKGSVTSRPRPPSRATSSTTSCPSSAPRVRIQRRVSNEATGFSSSPARPAWRTVSPPCRPAFWASEPATGGDSSARGSFTPIQLISEYSSTASTRLATGPAATISARDVSGCVLKAKCRSPSATGASRSSSILT